MKRKKAELLQGTLDLPVLKALALEPLHGLGGSRRIEQITKGTLQVKPGSLFLALHRMEEAGWLQSSGANPAITFGQNIIASLERGDVTLEAETESWQRIALAITSALKAT